ncbi:MAG: recombination mediator RecR [Endomicrobium sp.]|jgi:recombination protein RecR|nr:recombination mediator RecR [Endomicrobium sp.]
MNIPQIMERMIKMIKKLPAVGPKMAERLAYHILKMSQSEIDDLINSMQMARQIMKCCNICYNFSDQNPCQICSDITRKKHSILCVVETPQDLIAISKVKNYHGFYFVLGGALSPLDGIGPEDIRINKLIKRLKNANISEVIIATDTDSKGEVTATYIAKIIKKLNIKVTRLGYGLPVGGNIEYADEVTISRAIVGRQEM